MKQNYEVFNAVITLKPELTQLKDKFQETLLHKAIDDGSPECIELLIQNDSNVEERDRNDLTAVHRAARDNNIEAVEILLTHFPALVNATTITDKFTPLHLAAWKNNFKMVEMLVNKPFIDTDIKNAFGKTADEYGENEEIMNMIKMRSMVNSNIEF